ncbi:MAG TPA: DegV family protein [Anaerolineales bacterium]|nr:DegV family protein [Anaerolineales bacterium]
MTYLPGVSILTDSTAQFTISPFPGQDLVRVIPLRINLNRVNYLDGLGLSIYDLPLTARDGKSAQAHAPQPEEFRRAFLSLGEEHQEILAILLSARLSSAIANAHQAAGTLPGRISLTIFDSQTTGVGLGLLVQAAAEAAQDGATVKEIKQLVRHLVAHIYTVFYVQSLSYLSLGGHIDPAQAVVGEMLGVTPIILLENGRLVPVQKARSSRHLIDLLVEFLGEFGKLKHISLLKGTLPFESEIHHLRQRINELFPTTTFSEHILGTGLASILGPCSLGLVVMED